MDVNNTLELEIKRFGNIIAHASCFYGNDTVQIKDLFVREKFRNKGFDELLLEQIHEYAKERAAKKVVMYAGIEPFCPDPQIPLEEEMTFFKKHGYVHDHNVCGVVPCLIKTL